MESWRGTNCHGRDFDAAEFVESLTFKELRAFYRGIVCADKDFTQANAEQEIEHHLNFQRAQWEEEIEQELVDSARDMEDSRPDMYGAKP